MIYIILILLFISGLISWMLDAAYFNRIENIAFRIFANIASGISIVFGGIYLFISIIFSDIDDYPKITKSINDKYYFTQQEYGFAATMPGKHLEFYKRNKFRFDSKVGHIMYKIDTRDMDAKIEETNNPDEKRLVILIDNKTELDTNLNFKKTFEFEYYKE